MAEKVLDAFAASLDLALPTAEHLPLASEKDPFQPLDAVVDS